MNLGTLIKKEIKRQGKTQKEIAEIIGISNNAISQICIDATFPHKETLEKICKCLNVKIDFSIKKDGSTRFIYDSGLNYAYELAKKENAELNVETAMMIAKDYTKHVVDYLSQNEL